MVEVGKYRPPNNTLQLNRNTTMTYITIPLPDAVMQQYEAAARQLAEYLGPDIPPPNASTLMRFVLSGKTTEEIVWEFDYALRTITGAPVPNEPERWIFPAEFDSAP